MSQKHFMEKQTQAIPCLKYFDYVTQVTYLAEVFQSIFPFIWREEEIQQDATVTFS